MKKPQPPQAFMSRSPSDYPAARRLVRVPGESIVLEDDASGRIDFSMDGARIRKRAVKTTRSRPEIRILYLLHIVPSLSERGDAVSPINSSLTRIVRRQGQFQIAIVSFQQSL